jgi:hypothetical protein
MKPMDYLTAAIFFILGIIGGLLYPTKPTKYYPIEVSCYWETHQTSSYPTMEADSVKGDTIYKDGISIVNKNIKNVLFK